MQTIVNKTPHTPNKLLSLLCATALLAGCQTTLPLSEQLTTDLVLQHRQLSERISTPLPPRGGNVNVTVQTREPQSASQDSFNRGQEITQNYQNNAPFRERAQDIEAKQRIENELFRRWKSGDTAAELPIFKGLKP